MSRSPNQWYSQLYGVLAGALPVYLMLRGIMLSRLILLISALSLFTQSAWALPGESYATVSARIKAHHFLAPYYFFSPHVLGVGYGLTAFRQLQDGYFIDVKYDFDAQKIERDEQLELTQREYHTGMDTLRVEPGFTADHRPWAIKQYVDIWERVNPQALQLISEIYGDKIARDFQQAKMVFNGVEYVEYNQSEYYRERIRQLGESPIKPWANITLYAGKHWGYERAEEIEYPYHSLRIRPLKEVLDDVSLLQNNNAVYQKYRRLQDEKDRRTRPADIKIKQ